jgi:hypothetical protein
MSKNKDIFLFFGQVLKRPYLQPKSKRRGTCAIALQGSSKMDLLRIFRCLYTHVQIFKHYTPATLTKTVIVGNAAGFPLNLKKAYTNKKLLQCITNLSASYASRRYDGIAW